MMKRPALGWRRVTTWVAACGVVVLVHAAPAAAQDVEFGYGAIPGWSFTPAMSAGVMFDTNIQLSDASATTGETEGDRVFVFAPSGRLEYSGRRTDFSAGYSGLFRRYATATDLDRLSHQSQVSLRHAVSRTLSVFGRYSLRVTPTTDDLDVDFEDVPFVRRGSRGQTFSGGFDARLTKFTSASVRYSEIRLDFDRPESFLLGGQVRGIGAEVRRRVNERMALGGEYALRFAEVQNVPPRNLTFNDVGGTLSYRLAAATSLNAGAGISHLKDHGRDDVRVGPYGRISLTHQLPRVVVGATFERRSVPSFGFGGANATQELRGFVGMPLARNRLYVQGTAAWRHSNPYVETSVETDTLWLRSTLGYAVSRWMRTEGFYTFTYRDSIVTGGEISRHRTGVQVVVSQPMRIR